VVGGLVVPLVSRAQLSVCGPAAGLAAVVVAGIATVGSWSAFLVAGVLAGLIQLAMGVLRLGKASGWAPTSVVGGMLAAIGILLVMKQIPPALGVDGDAFVDEGAGAPSLAALAGAIQPLAVLVAAVGVGILVAWEKVPRLKALRLLPGPLAAVLAGVAMNELAPLVGVAPLGREHLVALPPASEWATSIALPDLAALSRPDVWILAVTLAVVASIESLLNVEAMDRLDPWGRRSPMNRELVAQGLANTASALLGGLPVTSVVVRSSTSMNAGARTRAAAMVHGLLLLASIAFLGPLLERIPYAVLAAILLVTGYKLARPAILRSAYAAGPEQFVPFAATVVGVVGTDLLKGVAIGIAAALVFALRRGVGVEVARRGERVEIRLLSNVPFFARGSVQQALDSVPPRGKLVVDAVAARSIHRDVLDAIRQYAGSAAKRRVDVELRGDL
jgi:MFS superfamily sulfate permease-like transporter